MITLALINFVISVMSQAFNLFTSPIHDMIANLATKITALSIPVIIYDTFNLCALFLPVGTIFTLFSITTAMICISVVLGFVRFVVHALGII